MSNNFQFVDIETTLPAIMVERVSCVSGGGINHALFALFPELGDLVLNPQELTARNFSLVESFKSGGILYVFPAFGTARIGEKSRYSAAGDLFRDPLRLHRKEGLPLMIFANHFETAPIVITLHIEGFHG